MNSTHMGDNINEEAATPSLEPRKHDHCRSSNDCNMDKMKIFSGQSLWPSHVESIQDEWQTLQDQIHRAQLQECNYHAAPDTFRCSSSSSEHEEWRLKMCEWMFAIVDFYGLHREVATMAMDLLDRSFHQPRVRQTLWSSIQQECVSQNNLYPLSSMSSSWSSSSQSPWLSVKEDSTQFYRWVAITSLFLAVKLVSPLRLYIGTFCQLVPGKTLRPRDLFTMERHLLQALHWQLHPPTALSYVTLYLRYLLLTFYKTTTSTTTKTINLTSEEAMQGDTSMIDDNDEKELNDALVWQGMVSSCETISETAQYLTEAMVFMNTPWRKQSTTTTHSNNNTSVWAMAAVWCALELYQVQNDCDNDENVDDGNYYTLWQDLIWHYLLPLLDLKWNQVQEVCRLLRPILSIQLAASEHDEEQDMNVTEQPLETSLCDETHRFGGGKTSPTSAIIVENEAAQHAEENKEKEAGILVKNSLESSMPYNSSSVQNNTNPTTAAAWGSKREIMMRFMLDRKRQKLSSEETVSSGNPPNDETNQDDEFQEKSFGRLVLNDKSSSHSSRSTQATVAAALFAERRLAESHQNHQGGRLGQDKATTNVTRAESQITNVATKLCCPHHTDNVAKLAGRAFPALRRPIPRRATASDDLVGNKDLVAQTNLA